MQQLIQSLPIDEDSAVTIRLIIHANHVLLHDGVCILNPGRNTFLVYRMLIKEVVRHSIRIGRIDQNIGYLLFNAHFNEQLSDIHHDQCKLLVSIDHQRFLLLHYRSGEVD